MIKIRRADERGHADHGWLRTFHTFSFGEYQDPAQMQFRSLRVMNEDWVAPGRGFPTHPHRDMEIVTYLLEGQLEHQDSMGNGEVLNPGEFQRMSAGTGITHSEFNPSDLHPVHLYQIWLYPNRRGLPPSYEQKQFPREQRLNRFCLVASPTGEDGSLTIHQDARIYLAVLDPDARIDHAWSPGRHGWLQVLRGKVRLNPLVPTDGQVLNAGDGAAISDLPTLDIESISDSEVMLFDLD